MSTWPARFACAGCGAVLASDQEYCIRCGTRRLVTTPSSAKGPIAVALAVVITALALLVVSYSRLRDDARNEARDISPPTQAREFSGSSPGASEPVAPPVGGGGAGLAGEP
jgi:hypothetical protein